MFLRKSPRHVEELATISRALVISYANEMGISTDKVQNDLDHVPDLCVRCYGVVPVGNEATLGGSPLFGYTCPHTDCPFKDCRFHPLPETRKIQ